jgi:penicillin-insensitive murein DD-endopeptidase
MRRGNRRSHDIRKAEMFSARACFVVETVRAVLAVLALASVAASAGCAELGVVTDGTSISYGKPSRGYLIDGVKLPDKGDGYTTQEVWAQRGNRYGTDELVDMLQAVARRMQSKVKDARLVIADLSNNGGGPEHLFHRSHQSGRDVDLLYYERDAAGNPFEADSMRVFTKSLWAKDKSGIRVDVPRTWLLVKELLTAPEATVQYIFMYQPIADKLIEYAQSINEDPVIVARAIKACRQPGDSAPHNDHMHVRVYCANDDRQFGCVDIGPLDLLAEREAEQQKTLQTIADALPGGDGTPAGETAAQVWAGTTAPAGTTSTAIAENPPVTAPEVSTAAPAPSASFSSLLRARADRIDLRGWR